MYDGPLSVIAMRCHPPQGAFSCPTGNSPCLPKERLVFLPKALAAYAYPTLPSARKARSHLRYTKTHFSCNEKCWSCYTRRVFQGRYNRLYLRLQFAITISLYMLPASQSDISTTSSFSRRIACDKLSLSVKGAGKIT